FTAGETAGPVCRGRRSAAEWSGGEAVAAYGGHSEFDDAARTGQARIAEGLTQATHCGRRRCLGSGGQPPAESVQPDGRHDEADEEGRHGQDDARHGWAQGFGQGRLSGLLTPADGDDDFQRVAVCQWRLGVRAARHDLAVAFHGNALSLVTQLFNQAQYGQAWVKLAFLAIQ